MLFVFVCSPSSRLLRNRVSAQQARERKKQHLNSLEDQVRFGVGQTLNRGQTLTHMGCILGVVPYGTTRPSPSGANGKFAPERADSARKAKVSVRVICSLPSLLPPLPDPPPALLWERPALYFFLCHVQVRTQYIQNRGSGQEVTRDLCICPLMSSSRCPHFLLTSHAVADCKHTHQDLGGCCG